MPAQLSDPVSVFGFMDSTLAGFAVGGVTGATVTSIQNGWNPTAAAPQVLRSAHSTREIRVIAAAAKPSPLMSGMFYGGVVGAYVATEKLSAGIRGTYDSWNAVPAAMVAGMGIGAKAGCAATACGMAAAIIGTKAFIHGSGAELGQTSNPAEYFYAGRGQEGRTEWLESKTTWMKAPYKDPNAKSDDDY